MKKFNKESMLGRIIIFNKVCNNKLALTRVRFF